VWEQSAVLVLSRFERTFAFILWGQSVHPLINVNKFKINFLFYCVFFMSDDDDINGEMNNAFNAMYGVVLRIDS